MLFLVKNKKVFTVDPSTGAALVTIGDLNEISDFTLEAAPLLPDAVPAWFRVRVLFSAFTAAATTENVELYPMPPGMVVHAVVLKHSAAFAGGAISAYTLSVGVAGNLTKYAGAFNVFQAPGAAVFQVSSTLGVESLTGTTSLRLAATATGANLTAATAGSIDCYLLLGRLPVPA